MDFEFVTPVYEEQHSSYDVPSEVVKLHAMGKALSIALNHPNSVVVGGDVIVSFEGTILGKPKSKLDAKRMLTMLSDKWHEVITGIAVINTENERKFVEATVSKVKIKKLGEGEINKYIETGEPLDKAGSYDVGGIHGRFLIEKYDGDIEGIRGFPTKRVGEIIKMLM